MHERILLVEDDDRDVELMLAALDQHNLTNQVDRVGDGAEALDYLYCRGAFGERRASKPLFILLDLKMPRMDGVEFLRRLREDKAFGSVPIIVLTSSREDRDLERCYELGANSYVVKPVEFDQFVVAVAGLGFYWAILNVAAPKQ